MNEYTYEAIVDNNGVERTDVIGRSDGAIIPTDPANSDYAAYLESLNDNTETE